MSVFHRLLNGTTSCSDLLACVFELNELETRTYFTLLETPDARVTKLAEKLDRERSTVHRAIQTLVNHGLAHRETVPMDSGGYYHLYRPTDPATVRDRIEQRLDRFDRSARRILDEFTEPQQTQKASFTSPARDSSTKTSS